MTLAASKPVSKRVVEVERHERLHLGDASILITDVRYIDGRLRALYLGTSDGPSTRILMESSDYVTVTEKPGLFEIGTIIENKYGLQFVRVNDKRQPWRDLLSPDHEVSWTDEDVRRQTDYSNGSRREFNLTIIHNPAKEATS